MLVPCSLAIWFELMCLVLPFVFGLAAAVWVVVLSGCFLVCDLRFGRIG